MKTRALKVDDWLSARQARELIFCFIRWGGHSEDFVRSLSEREIEGYLRETGYDLSGVISELQRHPHRAISRFENLSEGAVFEVEVSGSAKVTVAQRLDGVTINQVNVDQHAVLRVSHRAEFVAACKARDESIKNNSFDEFYTALAKGFSSIEAYLNSRAAVYNANADPANRLAEKRKGGGFITLSEKLRHWLPAMSGIEINFDLSPGWNDFIYLRGLRNDIAIHPKPGAGLVSLDELASGLNRFRMGIAAILFLLHQAFGEPMQSSLIRAAKFPDVRLRITTE